MKIHSIRNYVVIKSMKELQEAKQVPFCRFIICELSNTITVWNKLFGKWNKTEYTYFGEQKVQDYTVTGHSAYLKFYKYCGKEEVEKMKKILQPIPLWESYEQMHYYNPEFVQTKIHEPIYELDVNSAFTYGVLMLESGFDKLKEYMLYLYDKKKNAIDKITSSKYKNLMNFLIGYFARIKDFVALRSKIIHNSNKNVQANIIRIKQNNGKAYISSTDSIITDKLGFDAMSDYIGTNVGQFKVKQVADKLYYNSSNSYQIGDKVVFSGVKYFARKNTDFFKGLTAVQSGNFIHQDDIDLFEEDKELSKLCRVSLEGVTVSIFNQLGEKINEKYYTIKE